MKKVTGVRFKKSGKIYFFEIGEFNLEKGMHVIVDTAMGEEYGEIVIPYKEIKDEDVNEPLKKVVRIITDKDKKMYEENKAKEPEARAIFEEKVKKHNNLVERMALVEASSKSAHHRLDEIVEREGH